MALLDLAGQNGSWPFARVSLAHRAMTVNNKVAKTALELSVTLSIQRTLVTYRQCTVSVMNVTRTGPRNLCHRQDRTNGLRFIVPV